MVLRRAGVAFSNNLINELIKHGIEPIVTVYHFDLPAALAKRGGWRNRATIDAFVRFAQVCFEEYGDRVTYIRHAGYTLEDRAIMRNGKPDFIAFNYYNTDTVAYVEGTTLTDDEGNIHGPGEPVDNPHLERTAFSGWWLDPIGFRTTINEIYGRAGGIPQAVRLHLREPQQRVRTRPRADQKEELRLVPQGHRLPRRGPVLSQCWGAGPARLSSPAPPSDRRPA